jgi:hypothetical protein
MIGSTWFEQFAFCIHDTGASRFPTATDAIIDVCAAAHLPREIPAFLF